VVTISTNTGDEEADKERRYVVTAEVRDNAVPPNFTNASFAYTRDSEGPEISLSKSQSDIGSIGTATVTVGVGGTISDKNVIKVADLSIRNITAAGAECSDADNEMSQGRTGRVVRNKRDLENDTNKIEFDETFTIRRPTGEGVGPETYCFWLASADVAVEANGRGDGNPGDYELGSFTVGWPAGPPPPPPGPTFEFHPAGATTMLDSLQVAEGATSDNTYRVTLKDAPSGATYPLEMTIDASATVTTAMVSAANSGNTTGFENATDTVTVTVTPAHDLNIVSEMRTLTHKAEDFDDTDFPVRVLDDDYEITVSRSSVREDDDAAKVLVTLTAGSAPTAETTVDISFAPFGATTATADDFTAIAAETMTIAAGMTMDTVTVEVDATDDGNQDEQNEHIRLTGPNSDPATGAAYVKPATIMIIDDDPDIQLSLSQSAAAEGADAVTLTITATAKSEVGGVINATVTIAGADGASLGAADSTTDTDDARGPSTVSLSIDAGATVGTAEVTLTIVDDVADDDGETIQFSAANVTIGDKAYTFGSVKLAITDNDDS